VNYGNGQTAAKPYRICSADAYGDSGKYTLSPADALEPHRLGQAVVGQEAIRLLPQHFSYSFGSFEAVAGISAVSHNKYYNPTTGREPPRDSEIVVGRILVIGSEKKGGNLDEVLTGLFSRH
jgi:hypothetical protein